jgi:Domain of unknown function (DUF4374)
MRNSIRPSCLSPLIPLLLGACGGDDPAASSAAGAAPAVMLSVIATNPDERLTYVGAFPEVPSGEVGTDGMLEFGDAYYYAFNGGVFVYEREQATVTRYDVSDSYQLIRGKTVSFVNFGFTSGADLSFVAPDRAYAMVGAQNLVIAWDPARMEITGTFPAGLPTHADLDTYPAPIGVSGSNMYWALLSQNYDALQLYPRNVVAIAPAGADGPVTLVEDDRCVPALGGYIMTNGDIYLVGGADADAIAAYNPSAAYPSPCIVRIRAGATEFDPDYYVNLRQATGSPSIVGTWRINDESVLARVWDPTEPLPPVIDDYWAGQSFISKSIDLATGAATDFPALAKGGFSSNIQDRIDGATYFSLPRADGSADVAYRLLPAGIEEAFSIPGAGYWGMGRVR